MSGLEPAGGVGELSAAALVGELTALLSDVRKLGVEWRDTRFEHYLHVLQDWTALEQRQSAEEFATHRADLHRQRLMFEAISQVHQLLMSRSTWSRLDTDLLTVKLKAVLTGPSVPTALDPETGADHGRNTLVELRYASDLLQRGVPSALTTSTDLIAHFPGGHAVHVECKRPVAFDTIDTSLRRLRKQCWKRLDAGAEICLGVLAVERAYGFDAEGAMFRALDEQEAQTSIELKLDHAAEHVRKIIAATRRGTGPSRIPVLGLLFSGAMFLRRPTATIFVFTTVKHCDAGAHEDTPSWLADHL